MKRITLVAVVLLVFAAGFSSAQEQNRPFVVSIKPQMDIPLWPDPNLFQPGGGVGVSRSRPCSSFPALSMGIAGNYHLGRLQHADLGNLGSLSMISIAATTELRGNIRRKIDLYLSGGAGYFYAFLNGEPSQSVSNLVLNGRIGVGLRVNPTMTIGIQGEYRRYRSLYHLMGVGLGVDLWLEGVK